MPQTPLSAILIPLIRLVRLCSRISWRGRKTRPVHLLNVQRLQRHSVLQRLIIVWHVTDVFLDLCAGFKLLMRLEDAALKYVATRGS